MTKSDSGGYLLEFGNPKQAKQAKADLEQKLDSTLVKIEYPFAKVR